MEFIIGKYYKTFDNSKVECIGANGNGQYRMKADKWREFSVDENGVWFNEGECRDRDIVAEWSEQPLKLEVGKWYKAENGEVGECVGVDGMREVFSVKFPKSKICYFNEDGSRWYKVKEHLPELRIISEVPNPNQPSEVCEREIEPQEKESVPFDFNLLTTEQFNKHLAETIKNKKAQRERNLFGAIARAHQSHEVVPSWMLEEILSLRSEAETELFQKQFEPTKESELEKDGRNFEELEVGGVYYDREGDRVEIVSITEHNKEQPYKSDGGDNYSPNGNFSLTTFKSPYDLIRKIN